MQHLFVYGSLLFPEILKGLTGKTFKMVPATLPFFKRHLVKDADYPAIVEDIASEVTGMLLFEVDEKSMKILRFYEGDEYDCAEVTVHTKDGNIYTAQAYVWNASRQYLEPFDWDPEHFKQEALQHYSNKIAPQTLKEYLKRNR